MLEKVYLYLLILCVILAHCQVIVGKFLREDNELSSALLLRQKRVVDRRPGKELPLVNGDLPYIVNIKENLSLHCVGSILSHHTVITAARCVESPELGIYTVHSGSAYSFRGKVHNVREKKMHGHDPSKSSRFLTGIALLIVDPPFTYNRTISSIRLHSGPVLAGIQGIVAGWGHRVNLGRVESAYPQRLRLIAVPIMDHRECVNRYHGIFPITEEDVCTFDPQKACGNYDAGAPLVIDEQLAGVHIGEIFTLEEYPKPDIFVLLQHLNYSSWIMRNIVH